jgi:hypothetical protein
MARLSSGVRGMNGLLWIAVPAGLDGDQAVLRVLISPELDPDGPRQMSDEPMAAWPAMLRDEVAFEVEVTVGDTTKPPFVAEHRDDLQSEVWNAFFGSEDMIVMPRAARRHNYDADPFVEGVTSADAAYIARLYPPLAQLLAPGGPAAGAASTLPVEAPPWVRRQRAVAAPGPALGTDRGGSQTIHFDRVVGLLREHPTVLRALGLIVELRFPATRLRPAPPEATGMIRVRWPNAPETWQIESPLTRYEVSGDRFSPASTDEIKGGLVDLRRRVTQPATAAHPAIELPAWEVTTFDVDAAVDALTHAPPAEPGAAPTQPPFLRSAGLMLMRRGRQASLSRRRANAAANAARESRHDLELTADDLVLGYRIDVKPENGGWLSLCRRRACPGHAMYSVNGIAIGTPDASEEGHVKAAGAVLDASGLMRADEVVARWSGWSLVVVPPNFDHRPVDPDPETLQRMPFDFDFGFRVEPRSLPKLRFGMAYQLRCRVADITGGGVQLDEPLLDASATPAVTYLRHEPVPAPVLSLPPEAELGPGETVERLVIRGDAPASPCARLVMPPPTTRMLAEQHGLLDGDDAATFDLVLRGTELPDAAAAGVTIHVLPEPGVTERALSTDQSWAPWPSPGVKRIELRARGEGVDEPPLAWEGETLVVRLAPAQRLSLELSSNIRPELAGHFALTQSLGAAAHRHPMVSPARTLELVHAVKRPHDPVGPLTPARSQAGDTYVTLVPPADEPLLGVDPASTARIDISASWTGSDSFGVNGGVVASATLTRDTRELPALRHELGDTRQRWVTYEVTAISRFREFWPPPPPALEAADQEFEKGFLATTTLRAVNIPSSARPPAPVLLTAAPAFMWREGADAAATVWRVRERIRAGGILRVEFERPWSVSGTGEKLAVIVWPESPAPGELWPFLSQVANDPIWNTTPPDRFPVPSAFGPDGARAQAVRLSESGDQVMAIPYDVISLPNPSRCYADIALPEAVAASYCPFAQLALARYQPHSIEQLELSPIVRTEMVQLLPERRLRIERREADVLVSLNGVGPGNGPHNRVVARVERFTGRPADVFAVDLISFGEEPPDDRTPIWVALANSAIWGKLGDLMSLPVPSSGGPYRIHVREVDQIDGPYDDEPAFGADIYHRTVFADAIVLPGEGIVVETPDVDPPAGGR